MPHADTWTDVLIRSAQEVYLWIPRSEGNTGQLKTQAVCLQMFVCECMHISADANYDTSILP